MSADRGPGGDRRKVETDHRVRLAESPRHFAGLRRVMPEISQKVLTQQLRELMNDGIVRRQPTGAIPAPIRYSLTDYGSSVLPLVENVRVWGRGHLRKMGS